MISRKKIQETVAQQKVRGNVALKTGRIVSVEERQARSKQAEHTPHLDKLLEKAQ